jgi:hypothetical protein
MLGKLIVGYEAARLYDRHEAKEKAKAQAEPQNAPPAPRRDTLTCTNRAGRDTVIGGAVGYALAGKSGAVVGGLIGHHHGKKVCE